MWRARAALEHRADSKSKWDRNRQRGVERRADEWKREREGEIERWRARDRASRHQFMPIGRIQKLIGIRIRIQWKRATTIHTQNDPHTHTRTLTHTNEALFKVQMEKARLLFIYLPGKILQFEFEFPILPTVCVCVCVRVCVATGRTVTVARSLQQPPLIEFFFFLSSFISYYAFFTRL